ncbi:hypothetical protein RI367_001992 [Sorochytrium milnesiophthora]
MTNNNGATKGRQYAYQRWPHNAVVLKFCSARDNDRVSRLRWEYATLQALDDVVGVPRSLAMMTFEDVIGVAFDSSQPLRGVSSDTVTLSEYLQTHSRITVPQAFVLLRHIAAILEQIHSHGRVYCNISLDTTWLHFASGSAPKWHDISVTLTDFTFARANSNEIVPPTSIISEVCGDLRFISPECTGRTNRPIDQRSDIYSLGMLVHAALGGSQDTNANRTTSEIIHECLTVTPPPLSSIVEDQDSELTASLQRVLDSMTAKLPEDRIASCAEVIRKLDATSTAQPLLQSSSVANVYSTKLYGRDQELEQLRSFQSRVHTGTMGGLALVSGPSGVGKTALIRELSAAAFATDSMFVSGKSDQYKPGIPFLSIIHACSELVTMLLQEAGTVVCAVAGDIAEQLQDNFYLMMTVIPDLRRLLTAGGVAFERSAFAQEATDKSIASASQHPDRLSQRIRRGLSTTLKAVAAHRPLTVFLDDMQWADKSSLSLIGELATNGLPAKLCLVTASRDDDIASRQTVDKLKTMLESNSDKALTFTLALPPLNAECVRQMTLDLLAFSGVGDLVADADSLVQVVQQQAHGNPFFVRRLLPVLKEHDLSFLTTAIADLSVNTRAGARSTASTLDILQDQLHSFSDASLFVLLSGALLGHSFSLDDLSQLLKMSPSSVHHLLQPIVHRGYLRIQGGHMWDEVDCSDDGSVLTSFTDLYQQLGYQGLRTLDRKKLSAHGARYSLTDAAESPAVATITAIVAASSVDGSDTDQDGFDDGDLHSPVTYEWEHDQHQQAAVRLLRERSDYEHAYSAVGCSLLERLLKGERERVFDVVQLLRQAPGMAATAQDQVNLIKLIIVACSEARTTSAFETGLQYAHQAVDMVTDAVWDADYDVAFRAYHSLLASQHDTKRLDDMQNTLDVLSKRSLLPFDQALVMEMQIIKLISEGRPGEALEVGRAALALVGYPMPTTDAELKVIAQSLPSTVADKMLYFNVVQGWTEPIPAVLQTLMEALEAGVAGMNIMYLPSVVAALVNIQLCAGMKLQDVCQLIMQLDQRCAEIKANPDVAAYPALCRTVQLLCAADKPSVSLVPALMNQQPSSAADKFSPFMHSIYKLMMCVFTGEHAKLLACLESTKSKQAPELRSTFAIFEYEFYSAIGHMWLALHEAQAHMARAIEHLGEVVPVFERRAARSPSTFACRLECVRGCLQWLQGDTAAALASLGRAIHQARRHGFTQVEALANEVAGQFMLTQNWSRRLAAPYMLAAREAYQRWGAEWKARSLDGWATGHGDDDAWSLTDACTLVDRIQQQTTPDDLVRHFMAIATEISTADRGCLLWARGADAPTLNGLHYLALSQAETAPTPPSVRLRPSPAEVVTIAPLLSPAAATLASSNSRSIKRWQQDGQDLLMLPLFFRQLRLGLLCLVKNKPDEATHFTSEQCDMLRLLSAQFVPLMQLFDQQAL